LLIRFRRPWQPSAASGLLGAQAAHRLCGMAMLVGDNSNYRAKNILSLKES
jgi:hypothetical protein